MRAAHFRRIQMQLFGDLVQMTFQRVTRLRSAVSALGTAGRLDKIAEELHLDPAEMRSAHLVKPNSVTANYLRIGSMGLGACIDKVVAGSDWKNKFSWNVTEPRAVANGSKTQLGWQDPLAIARGSDTTNRKLPYGKGIGIACSSYICGAGVPIYWNNMPQSGLQLPLARQARGCEMG